MYANVRCVDRSKIELIWYCFDLASVIFLYSVIFAVLHMFSIMLHIWGLWGPKHIKTVVFIFLPRCLTWGMGRGAVFLLDVGPPRSEFGNYWPNICIKYFNILLWIYWFINWRHHSRIVIRYAPPNRQTPGFWRHFYSTFPHSLTPYTIFNSFRISCSPYASINCISI